MKRIVLLISLLIGINSFGQQEDIVLKNRWSREKAAEWYKKHDWISGANFIPSTAINQLEMWQANTFDTAIINQELGWAADLGMNTMRVYLHDLLWQQD